MGLQCGAGDWNSICSGRICTACENGVLLSWELQRQSGALPGGGGICADLCTSLSLNRGIEGSLRPDPAVRVCSLSLAGGEEEEPPEAVFLFGPVQAPCTYLGRGSEDDWGRHLLCSWVA